MKYLYIIPMTVLAFTSCSEETTDTNQEENTQETTTNLNETEEINSIQELITNSYEEIWTNLDADKIEIYHADDYQLYEDNLTWNNDSVRNYINSELSNKEQFQRINQIEFLETELDGDKALLSYNNYAKFLDGSDTIGSLQWTENTTVVKDNGEWKIKEIKSTTVSRDVEIDPKFTEVEIVKLMPY